MLQRARRYSTKPSANADGSKARSACVTDGGRPTTSPSWRRKRVVGTARCWHIVCGTGQTALLLGPVAIASDWRNRGIGTALVRHALAAARCRGHRALILVGDAPYYSRFGYTADKTAALRMPGPFERQRLLALELVPDALKGARGLLRAPGVPASREGFAASAA